jgi:hypothetical protein
MTTVISFYTPDWDYPKYAKQLQEDCKKLGLTYHIVEKSSENNYVKNCNMKPFFIKDMLQFFKGPVLWIDADGGIESRPELLLADNIKNFDVAGNRSLKDSNRIHVGSIWFNYTEPAVQFVNAWCDAIIKSGIDDAVFNSVWQEFSSGLTFYELPPEYFVILNTPQSPVPDGSCIIHRLSNSSLKQDYKNKIKSNK